jgi:hypothetical protein
MGQTGSPTKHNADGMVGQAGSPNKYTAHVSFIHMMLVLLVDPYSIRDLNQQKKQKKHSDAVDVRIRY